MLVDINQLYLPMLKTNMPRRFLAITMFVQSFFDELIYSPKKQEKLYLPDENVVI